LWLRLAIQGAAVIAVLFPIAAACSMAERKISAWIQGRPGPNRTVPPFLAGIPIIVLDLPIYRLDPQMEKDLSVGRRILQKDLPPNVHYVRFEADRVENDPTYFYDASHLNAKGRAWLSEKLADEITRTLAQSKSK
ncbi:MAG TPA: NADH-quinone oxidoreductase subunit H, partial [Leptospiraceae bacterium]|nr:NADH-quinone oxidoreductase subunit H [Leptospiraceae bacterium]